MRFVTEKARAVLRSVGLDLKGLKLITLWEMALTENGEEVVAAAETERKQQYAARAKQLIETSDEVVNSESFQWLRERRLPPLYTGRLRAAFCLAVSPALALAFHPPRPPRHKSLILLASPAGLEPATP